MLQNPAEGVAPETLFEIFMCITFWSKLKLMLFIIETINWSCSVFILDDK